MEQHRWFDLARWEGSLMEWLLENKFLAPRNLLPVPQSVDLTSGILMQNEGY